LDQLLRRDINRDHDEDRDMPRDVPWGKSKPKCISINLYLYRHHVYIKSDAYDMWCIEDLIHIRSFHRRVFNFDQISLYDCIFMKK